MHHTTIVLLLSSPVIRTGIESMILKNREISINVLSSTIDTVADISARKSPSLIVADPIYTPTNIIDAIRLRAPETRLCALYTSALPQEITRKYDETFSIYDTADALSKIIMRAAKREEEISEENERRELSPREKEIVKAIVKGFSNKEIATMMNLSVNTVMTHRRNIASKLKIHSPAGLTIYAIVSKLVSLEEVSDMRDE